MPFNAQNSAESMIRTIHEISTAVKVVSFYPSHHPAVRVAVDRVLATLGTFFNREAQLELAFSEAGILHHGEYLPDTDPALKAFAAFLLNRGVARIIFRRGLDSGSLTELLRLLGTDPRRLTTQGGVARQLQEKKITTVEIGEIDLEKILASDAEPVPGDAPAGQEEMGAWKRLVTSYLRDPGSKPPAGIRTLLKSLATETPRLVEWLEDTGVVSGKELSKLVGRLAEEIRKEVPDCLAGFASQFGEALLQIDPKLRLDLMLQKIPLHDGSDLMERVASSLNETSVVGLIASLIEAERQLSPRLFAVCSKVFGARGKSAPYFGAVTARITDREGEASDLGRIWQSLQGLLVESDQDYLSETYKATLETVAERSIEIDPELRGALEASGGFQEGFAAEAISDHACRVIMAALEIERDPGRVEDLRDDLERRSRRMTGRERMGLLAEAVRAISTRRWL